MVKYSSRWPRRTRSWRFGVVAVATFPLSPERTRSAKTRHLILDEGEGSLKAMLSGLAATVGVVLPDRSIRYWLADPIAAVSEGAWRLFRLLGDPPLTRRRHGDGARLHLDRREGHERTRVSATSYRIGGIDCPRRQSAG